MPKLNFQTNLQNGHFTAEIPGNVFANLNYDQGVDLDQLRTNLTALRRLAKANATHLSGINQVTAFIKANAAQYMNDLTTAQATFKQVVQGWQNYEMTTGFNQDPHYQQLQQATFAYQRLHNQNSLLMKMRNLDRQVKRGLTLMQAQLDQHMSMHTTTYQLSA